MTDKITVTATIFLDEAEKGPMAKVYQATAETLKLARFFAEKKARAYLRRRNLSVTMDNVVKERCPDCETKTTFTVHNLEDWVPPPDPLDKMELDWFLDDPNWAPEGYSNG